MHLGQKNYLNVTFAKFILEKLDASEDKNGITQKVINVNFAKDILFLKKYIFYYL